jgi:hypothetical protein
MSKAIEDETFACCFPRDIEKNPKLSDCPPQKQQGYYSVPDCYENLLFHDK